MASPKSLVIDALMNNPKLFNQVKEAFTAPVGSTKRKKAALILKSMHTSASNRVGSPDGQGGATTTPMFPMSMPMSSSTQMMEQPPQPANPLLIPNPVMPGQTRGQALSGFASNAGRAIGQGIWNAGDWIGNNVYKPALIDAPAAIAGAGMNALNKMDPRQTAQSMVNIQTNSQMMGNFPGSTGIAAGYEVFKAILNKPTATSAKEFNKQVDETVVAAATEIAKGGKISDFLTLLHKKFPSLDEATLNDKLLKAVKKAKGTSQQTAQQPGKTQTQQPTGALGNQFQKAKETVAPGSGAPGGTPQVNAQANGWAGTPQQSGSPSGINAGASGSQFGGQTGMQMTGGSGAQSGNYNTGFPTLDRALNAQTGPVAFSQQMLSPQNKAELAKFLGVDEKVLPDSNLLYANANDIIDKYKKELQINEIQQQLMDRINAGSTLGEDLKTYIATRDEAVNSIDKMIDSAKTYMKGLDMANPANQKDMQNYMNYLTILKGRQQKRYIDFANQSITQYNTQTEQLQKVYETNWNKFTDLLDQFKNDQTQAQAVYSRLDAMLQDMYTNVGNREVRELEKMKLMQDVFGSASDMGNTVISGYIQKDWDIYQNILKNSSVSNQSSVKDPSDPNGNKTLGISDTNIASLLNYASQQFVTEGDKRRSLDPNGILEALTSEMRDNAKTLATASSNDGGSFAKMTDTYLKRIKEFWSQLGKNEDGTINEAAKANVQLMMNALRSGMKDRINSQLWNDEAAKKDVLAALQDLTLNTKGWNKARTWGEVSSDSFLNEWKTRHGGVNKVVLDSVADYIKANPLKGYESRTVDQVLSMAVNSQYDAHPEWRKAKVMDFSPDDMTFLIMDRFSPQHILL